jgi:hypothetical protein
MITMDTSTWTLICVGVVLVICVFAYLGFLMGRDVAEKRIWDANIFPEMETYTIDGREYVRPRDPRKASTVAVCLPENALVVTVPYSEMTHHIRTATREDPMVIDFPWNMIMDDITRGGPTSG